MTIHRRARSAEDKRKRTNDLLAAARQLATERGGVRHVTLAAVTDVAGLHPSAVRRYFASKEELLLEKDELQKVWLLRKALSQLNPVEGMELLLDKLKLTKSNKEFLASMHSMG